MKKIRRFRIRDKHVLNTLKDAHFATMNELDQEMARNNDTKIEMLREKSSHNATKDYADKLKAEYNQEKENHSFAKNELEQVKADVAIKVNELIEERNNHRCGSSDSFTNLESTNFYNEYLL